MGNIKKSCKAMIGCLFKEMLSRSRLNFNLIIMYHRVADKLPASLHDPHIYVTSATLDMHVKELKCFFEVVPLGELLSCGRNSARFCSITFDDGWQDNYSTALPILLDNRTNATIFLPVADIGTSHWFWFEQVFNLANAMKSSRRGVEDFLWYFNKAVSRWGAKELTIHTLLRLNELLKYMPSNHIHEIINIAYYTFQIDVPEEPILINWEQVNEMGEKGINFGSHGMNHDIIPLLDRKLKEHAVEKSLAVLKDNTDHCVPFFSYPNGDWDLETISYLKDSGYEGATTTALGCANSLLPYQLSRIGFTEISSNTPNLLWFQIAKAYFRRDASQSRQ